MTGRSAAVRARPETGPTRPAPTSPVPDGGPEQHLNYRIPLPWHPYWRAFMTGYDSGIAQGIEIGRAQVKAEEWPVWRQFLDHTHDLATRPGPIGYAERQEWLKERARKACWHPDLTIDQIIQKAHQSWGLSTDPADRPTRTAF